MENKHIINGRRVASDKISTLAPGEIFVFGSNMEGMHGGGAARYANKNFGAEWGVGEGLTGRTYALPTMEGKASMKQAVEHFTSCAKEHPELTFLVTAIGCGIAGYSPIDVAPLFECCRDVENISLPAAFWDLL